MDHKIVGLRSDRLAAFLLIGVMIAIGIAIGETAGWAVLVVCVLVTVAIFIVTVFNRFRR